ncbi:hypothetical protein C7212DRAFT_346824 [Tuber magnatum]|uniref:Uncharacterized protein n=1 Tax=Tuber magnatum TaxID=42249 RepID=A0A317SHY7_9PEZI|nr:hypothetical protein C7212DRAFT_346824 [Tuber magnatum]
MDDDHQNEPEMVFGWNTEKTGLIWLQEIFDIETREKNCEVLMPARQVVFTKNNILGAWESAGAIPLNLWRIQKSETQENCTKVPRDGSSRMSTTRNYLPKTPGANTVSSKKLKELLTGLSEGFQQAIVHRALEEESHHQYRELVRKSQRINTSGGRKLTVTTVATMETVLHFRENRECLDAEKAARQAHKLSKALDSLFLNPHPSKPIPKSKKKVQLALQTVVQGHTVGPGAESTHWQDGGNSDSSLYKGPSRAPCGTHSTDNSGIERQNMAQSDGIE